MPERGSQSNPRHTVSAIDPAAASAYDLVEFTGHSYAGTRWDTCWPFRRRRASHREICNLLTSMSGLQYSPPSRLRRVPVRPRRSRFLFCLREARPRFTRLRRPQRLRLQFLSQSRRRHRMPRLKSPRRLRQLTTLPQPKHLPRLLIQLAIWLPRPKRNIRRDWPIIRPARSKTPSRISTTH